MSCEVRLIAPLDGLVECRNFLFSSPVLGGEDWLKQCVVSISPTADRVVLAHESALAVLSTRWVRSKEREESIPHLYVSCQWDGDQRLLEKEKITSAIILPLAASGQASAGGPDWVCIAVGFSSGFIRFFTESMVLLAEEQMHTEPLIQIKAISLRKGRQIGPDGTEFVYAVYPNVVCSLAGFSLFQTLRGCRGQITSKHAKSIHSSQKINLDYKKYSLSAVTNSYQSTHDACLIGCGLANNFDHLLKASLSEGFRSNYRMTPTPQTLIASTGDSPWFKYQYTRDTMVAPVTISDVAATVISNIPSWLGWGSNKVAETQVKPADKLDHKFSLTDRRRSGRFLLVSPDGTLFVIPDKLGRVTLIDARTGIAIRMWKGYRDAECAFIEVEEEKSKSRHRRTVGQQSVKRALFLVIYAPKKNLLDIFSLKHGPLVASIPVSKLGRLVYTPHGLLGHNASGHKIKNASSIPVAFLSEDGLMDIIVPFHCALTDVSGARAKDIHLVKQLRAIIKEDKLNGDKLMEEVNDIANKLGTVDGRLYCIDTLIGLKAVTVHTLLKVISIFLSIPAEGQENPHSNSRNLQQYCQQLQRVLNLFMFVTENIGNNMSDSLTVKPLEKVLSMSQRDTNILLEFLKHTQQITSSSRGIKVAFDDSSSALMNYLQCFDFEGASDIIKMKMDFNDEGIQKLGETLFSFVEKYPSEIDEWMKAATESQIEALSFARAFLLYKLQKRSTYFSEGEMVSAVAILKTLSAMTDFPLVSGDNCIVSPWWAAMRQILSNAHNVLIALPLAVCCRSVTIMLENERLALASEATEETVINETWEAISTDIYEWSTLLSSLEETSLLNAVLSTKPLKNEKPPIYGKFIFDAPTLSCKDLVDGKEALVAEFVGKWLCQFVIPPERLINKTDVEFNTTEKQLSTPENEAMYGNQKKDFLYLPLVEFAEESKPTSEFLSRNLGNFDILKRRFPFALTSSTVLSNVSWELFLSWQKNLSVIEFKVAAIDYLECVPSPLIRSGVAVMAWTSHTRSSFEALCRLMGKCGRLPTDQLCSRELSLSRQQIPTFLTCVARLLTVMLDSISQQSISPFPERSLSVRHSLVKVAITQPKLNEDLVFLHYEVATVLLLMAALEIRQQRVVSVLFDPLKSELFGPLSKPCTIPTNNPSLHEPRSLFLKRAISASVQTIQQRESDSGLINYEVTTANRWLKEIWNLASIWGLPNDDLRRHHVCELYSCGLDRLAEETMPVVQDRKELASQMLVLLGKRVNALMRTTQSYPELMANLTPNVSNWVKSLEEDTLRESTWNAKDAEAMMSRILNWISQSGLEYSLARSLADSLPRLS